MAQPPKVAVPESNKNRRKWTLIWAGVAAVVVVIGALLMQQTQTQTVAVRPEEKTVKTNLAVPGESLNEADSLARIQQQAITGLQAELQATKAQVADLNQKVAAASTPRDVSSLGPVPKPNEFQVSQLAPFPGGQPRTVGGDAQTPPIMPPTPRRGGPDNASPYDPSTHKSMMLGNAPEPDPKGPPPPSSSSSSIVQTVSAAVSPSTAAAAAPAPKPVRKVTVAYLPAGSYVTAVMLGGVEAPTGGQAQANPHPVLLKAIKAAQLPNNRKVDIKDCVFIGAAHGDLSSERAYIRLETASCTLPGGQVAETSAKGFVDGPDGKTGIYGKLVTKEGTMLARAFIAGMGAGIGGAFQQSAYTQNSSALGTSQVVNANEVARYGASGGVATAFNKLADYYLKMAEQTFSLVEVPAGVEVQLVFNAPLRLEAEFTDDDAPPAGIGVSESEASALATAKP